MHGEGPRRPGGHGGEDEDDAPSHYDEDDDDDDSPAHSDLDDDAEPLLNNGEFDPRHQFNVRPGNNPGGAHGNPAERRAAHHREWRGTPVGWNPNAGSVAARMAWHGGSVYPAGYGGAYGGNGYPVGHGGAYGGSAYPAGYGGVYGGSASPVGYGGAQAGRGKEREKKNKKKKFAWW